ncbi:hypothetical protein CC79DRAFT_218713 [Sarocladium strictum]
MECLPYPPTSVGIRRSPLHMTEETRTRRCLLNRGLRDADIRGRSHPDSSPPAIGRVQLAAATTVGSPLTGRWKVRSGIAPPPSHSPCFSPSSEPRKSLLQVVLIHFPWRPFLFPFESSLDADCRVRASLCKVHNATCGLAATSAPSMVPSQRRQASIRSRALCSRPLPTAMATNNPSALIFDKAKLKYRF